MKAKGEKSEKDTRRSTVGDVIKTLRVVPSFAETFSGDVLPEAVLLKNILEEMMTSLGHLSTLSYILLASLQNTPNGSRDRKTEDESTDIMVNLLD